MHKRMTTGDHKTQHKDLFRSHHLMLTVSVSFLLKTQTLTALNLSFVNFTTSLVKSNFFSIINL